MKTRTRTAATMITNMSTSTTKITRGAFSGSAKSAISPDQATFV
jgi:hypothetical protein